MTGSLPGTIFLIGIGTLLLFPRVSGNAVEIGKFLAQAASAQKCDLELSVQGKGLTSDFEVALAEIVGRVEKPVWRIDINKMLVEKGSLNVIT